MLSQVSDVHVPPHLSLPAGAACKRSLQSRSGSPSRGRMISLSYSLFMVYGIVQDLLSATRKKGTEITGLLQLTHRNVCGAVSTLWVPSLLCSSPFSLSFSRDNSINQPLCLLLETRGRHNSLPLCGGTTLRRCVKAPCCARAPRRWVQRE